jgi:flagellar protein FlbT
MTALILELKQGESMILNGALIRFKTRTRIELNTQARFLFGKQIMQADEALEPAQKLYYALQQAYIGPEDARPDALAQARRLIHNHRQSTLSPAVRELLDHMHDVTAEAAGFEALKLARQLIREETLLA